MRDQPPPDSAALPGIFHQHAKLSGAAAGAADQGREADYVAVGLAGCHDIGGGVG